MDSFHPAEPVLEEKRWPEVTLEMWEQAYHIRELRSSLNHAAMLLALASDRCRTVDMEGDRFDLLAEAERFDEILERTA